MLTPAVWGRVAGLLKRANRIPGLVIRVEDGEASLWFDERSGDAPYRERGLVAGDAGLRPVSWDVSPIIAETAYDDPVRVILAGRTRFTVPGAYGDVTVDDCSAWATFEEAVAAARTTIVRTPYPTLTPKQGDLVEDGVVVVYSGACVALRTGWRDAPQGASLGADSEIVRWTVTRDRVILNPPARSVTGEQERAARALGDRERGKHGWA